MRVVQGLGTSELRLQRKVADLDEVRRKPKRREGSRLLRRRVLREMRTSGG